MPGVSDLHQREVTRDHGPIRALVSFELNRNLSANMRRARLFGYSLRLAYSGRPAGFIFTCFYLSKIQSGEVVGLSSLWNFFKSQSLQINMHLEYLIYQICFKL